MKKVFFMLMMLIGISAQAQEIRAVVNDDLILDYDVTARAEMISQMMGIPVSQELRDRTLEKLIEESVKVRTAQKDGIEVSKEEVAEGVSFLENQNGLNQGTLLGLLSEKGIDTATLIRQIESDIAWMKYLQKRGEKAPEISDEEVTKRRDKIKEDLMKGSYLLAEIYIPFGKDKSAALEKTQALFGRIVSGEAFPEVARQASRSKTSEVGGDMGWVPYGSLEKSVEDVLKLMRPGQLSKPIEGEKGYYLMLLRDNRSPLSSQNVEVWTVSQMLLDKETAEKTDADIQKTTGSCEAFTQLAKEKGQEGSGSVGEMVVSRMPQDLVRILTPAKENAVVGPVDADGFVLYLMKCDIRQVDVLPSQEEVKMQIVSEKMEELSNKILKEFVEKAVVERR